MKKAVIKRRKRVIPAAQGSPDEGPGIDSIEQQSQYSEPETERGSFNPDGSVNLGFRRRQERSLAILPEPIARPGQSSAPSASADLNAYHTSHSSHSIHLRESLTDENRLAPLTSLTATGDRQSSLSPASFLSPSRKRSFSATDSEFSQSESGHDSSKRLSSIKSILNPSGREHSPNSNPMEDAAESLRMLRSPAGTMASAPSPGSYSVASSAMTGVQSTGGDRVKAERRAALQQEAVRMRELLAAKERELADLEE